MTMTFLVDVQKKIQRVDGMIADLKRTALANPRPSVFANIRSLQKEQRYLLQEFEHFAAVEEEDVYRYRLINATRPTIGALADAWKSFQEMFTATYQSLKQGSAPTAGKKKKAKVNEFSVPIGPQFAWGYSYEGSIGVGLTLPRRAGRLMDDPDIEKATDIIFSLASAGPEGITEVARRVGPATVTAMYRWADVHAQNQLGVGIEWRRDLTVKREVTLPLEKVVLLRDSLAKTTIETQVIVTGELLAVDVEKSAFRIAGDNGEEYSGTYTDAITREHRAVLPARYTATISKVTKAVLNPDEEDVSEYRLVLLTQL